jgi:hypothetical protein
MKNILFNTNLEVNKFQLQLFPKGWRITSQYLFFMANQLNTVPSPPIGTFASEQIAQELLLVAERYVSRIFTCDLCSAHYGRVKELQMSCLNQHQSHGWNTRQCLDLVFSLNNKSEKLNKLNILNYHNNKPNMLV